MTRKVFVFLCLIGLIIIIALFHPLRFATYDYPSISMEDMEKELLSISDGISDKYCPIIPAGISDIDWVVSYSETEVEDEGNVAAELKVKPGGVWEPSNCTSQHKVTLVVPYRDRQWQLDTFLIYIHHFLQLQLVSYRVLVIEQSFEAQFNRGKLFNVGFMEGEKLGSYPCYIFHDVDLLPEKLLNIYSCTRQPRHMSSNLDQFRYNLIYPGLFGGAIAMTNQQYSEVNGYSNVYYGWGGEDDDMKQRLDNKGYVITRFPPSVSRYMMLSHSKATPNEERFHRLKCSQERFDTDGLFDLNYTVIATELRPLSTWIYVNVLSDQMMYRADSKPVVKQ